MKQPERDKAFAQGGTGPRRVSVVLFNLGGPDSLRAVRGFLFNLFNDAAIITVPQPFRWLIASLISTVRTRTAKAIYRQIGGASPLLAQTDAQAQALRQKLEARFPQDEVQIVVAMRHWRPLTADAVKAVRRHRAEEIVLLPLYPQFSGTTTGSSLSAWRQRYKGPACVHTVCCYPDQTGLVSAHAKAIMDAAGPGGLAGLRLVFSAHGLPEKIILDGDPYQSQVERTVAAVVERLGATDWRISYQSRVGPLKWIGPSTQAVLSKAGRDGVGVVVVPIAFVSEHSETLVELDIDYRHWATEQGVTTYIRAPAIGVIDDFIEGLADMVVRSLGQSGTAPGASPCQAGFGKCPWRAEAKA